MPAFHFIRVHTPSLLSLTIESDRLLLVIISEKFAQNIFREFTDDITQYMLPSPAQDITETRNFIAESRRGIELGYNLQFAILAKPQGEFLGCCGLHGEDSVRTPELGIWIKKSAHGNGYGREAIHMLVNWALQHIDLDSFLYPVDRHNIASSKIPESLGGKIVEELITETLTGKILDKVVYQIDRFKTSQV
jgi:[ribosomal protein S5]-alanine N-acetyltransferase